MLDCTANPVVTGFTLPKLLWVRDNEPALFARIRRVLLAQGLCPLPAYRRVRQRSLGCIRAPRCSMWSTGAGHMRWPMLRNRSAPSCPPSTSRSRSPGRLSQSAAEATGLAAGTPVVGGGGDQAASAVGNGIVESGIVSCTLGTSGVVFAHMDKPAYDPQGRVHTFCHAVKGKWHVMGVTQGAGLSLQWFRNQLAPGCSYDELIDGSRHCRPWFAGIVLASLPDGRADAAPGRRSARRHGSGSPHATRAPTWFGASSKASVTASGMVWTSSKAWVFRSPLCGCPAAVRKVPFWRQTMADILDKRVTTLASQEGSAYGAALLAVTGTGTYGTIEECCRVAVAEVDQAFHDRPKPRSTGSCTLLIRRFTRL